MKLFNLGFGSTLGVSIGLAILGRFFLRRWLYLYYLHWARQSYGAAEGLKITLRLVPVLIGASLTLGLSYGKRCPEIGLGGVVFVPILVLLAARQILEHQRIRLEESFLSFIYALQGMVEVGWSLPTALFKLAHGMDGKFSERLRRYLRKYREGTSLLSCLERFRTRHPSFASGRALLLLELSYRSGLSVLPILETILPTLEARFQMAQKQRTLMRSVLAQGLTAALLPYGVLYFVWMFEPSLLSAQKKVVLGTIFGVVVWQGLGAWVLKAWCRFN